MPAVLREHQYEISTADGARALVFGTEDTGYKTLTRPVWSGSDGRYGDVDRVLEDGRYFGRDYLNNKSITFEIGVLTDSVNALGGADPHRANLNYLDTLEGWWRDSRLRARPWDHACLRCYEAGQTWRAYGRPRRYEEAAGRLTILGYTPVVCDFTLIDDRVYADTVSSITIGLVPPPAGGFSTPLIAPITTTLSTTGQDVAVVTGVRSTWPWVTFYGPVTNPSVQLGDLTVGLRTTIPDGLWITIDTRPWSRSVQRNDGANYSGSLSYETPVLREVLLQPGSYEVVYRGTDATGTTECTVSWRNARSRP